MDERERNVVKRRIVVKRSIKEVHFPRVKTLEEFDFETLRIYPRRGSASWPKENTSGGLNR